MRGFGVGAQGGGRAKRLGLRCLFALLGVCTLAAGAVASAALAGGGHALVALTTTIGADPPPVTQPAPPHRRHALAVPPPDAAGVLRLAVRQPPAPVVDRQRLPRRRQRPRGEIAGGPRMPGVGDPNARHTPVWPLCRRRGPTAAAP